jgi:exopolysaccharide biosynthesis protein
MGTDGIRIFWIVIDGRDPIHSLGATMEEAKDAALALGLKSAINLDGGASSQLVWMGMTVNKPSGEKERLLPYAVIMRPKNKQTNSNISMRQP